MGAYFPYVNVEKGLMVSPFVAGQVYDVKHVQAYYPMGDEVEKWISMGGKSITSNEGNMMCTGRCLCTLK